MNKTIRRILLGVGVVVGGFLAIRIASILMAWSIYSWFFQTLRNSLGIQDTLNGAFSIWLMAITLMVIPTFLSVVFWKKDIKKVAIVVGVLSGWCVISYFMSQPKEGRFFNQMTGQAMYRYVRTPDGRIEIFPLGYKFHPRYGAKLELVTPEVVGEIDQIPIKARAAQELEEERRRRANEVALKLAQKEQEIAQQKAQEREREERKEAEKIKAAEAARVVVPPPQPQRPLTWKTVNISDIDVVSVNLCQGFQMSLVSGGAVVIIPGGKNYRNKIGPGFHHPELDLSEGMVFLVSDPIGSRMRMSILNCW